MIDEDEIRPDQRERLRIWQEREQTAGREKEIQRRQFEQGYGPYLEGKYKIGVPITYRDHNGRLQHGTVLWSFGPGRLPVSQKEHLYKYLVSSPRPGWPPVEIDPEQVIGVAEP